MPQDFDLSSGEYREKPFEVFARLREQGPIVRGRLFPFMGKVWLATTYAAVDDL